jgi:zinc transport system ATP-binding protein
MALIACQDASFAYEGHIAVQGLNFEVNSGDYLCIVGENGSGKSTLIKGLLKLKSPQSGSVLIGDGLGQNEIGYLPQQTAAQKDFPASVYEAVLSGRLGSRGLLPFYSKKDKAIADGNIEKLGIKALRDQCYRELSGGQQQRVLLARALCATKKIMLLDEPVAGLDPMMTLEFYRMVDKINHEDGIAVIMVSHDIGSAIKYASHILHLRNTQMFFGETEEYVKTRLGAAFVGNHLESGDAEND